MHRLDGKVWVGCILMGRGTGTGVGLGIHYQRPGGTPAYPGWDRLFGVLPRVGEILIGFG